MRDAGIAGLVLVAFAVVGLACTTGPGETLEPTLSTVQEEILSPRCSLASCHGGGQPVRGLDLQEGAAHTSLVNRESSVPGKVYVVPGDPAASFLLTVVTMGSPDDAIRQMPPGFDLPAEEIELLEAWIEAGALDD